LSLPATFALGAAFAGREIAVFIDTLHILLNRTR